jgi:hypothetical protein
LPPLFVRLASQNVPREALAGRVNSSFQLFVAAPLLEIVNLPWYPEPQSESLLKLAVNPEEGAAGLVAAIATPTPPPTANTADTA